MNDDVVMDFDMDVVFPDQKEVEKYLERISKEVNEEIAPKLKEQGYISEADIIHIVYEKLGIRNYTNGWKSP